MLTPDELQKYLDKGYKPLPIKRGETDKNEPKRTPENPDIPAWYKGRLVGRGDLEKKSNQNISERN